MNMMGNLAGFVMPVVGGLILQRTAGNWNALIHLMILADVLAALSWLYLNPEGTHRQRERAAARSGSRLADTLNAEGASL